MNLRSGGLWWQTVRRLRPGQILSRCRHNARRAIRRATHRRPPRVRQALTLAPQPLYRGLADVRASGPWDAQVSQCIERAAALARGEFRFLNRQADFSKGIVWDDPGSSRLWRFHLHYCDCVRDLLVWAARGDRQPAYGAFRAIAASWMDHNGILRGDGWHPYTVSMRIVNWLNALHGFAGEIEADPHMRARLHASLWAQGRFLSHNLETDVLGNHLVANLRALALLGLAGEGMEARQWLASSLDMLRRELAAQVLPDGGHYERNPGYHAQVLRHCLEVAFGLRAKSGGAPDWLDEALRRMLRFLAAILPPDGGAPLLKDTTRDTPAPGDLIAAGALYLREPSLKRSGEFPLYALLLCGAAGWEQFRAWEHDPHPQPPAALIESGFYVLRDDAAGEHVIFDAGMACPDHLPAHAHADLLSYELCVSGERILVDSGVYEYQAGPWRDYFRSTRAHNTVEIAGADQSEVWGSFRVARRARPVRPLWQEAEDYVLVQAGHDGYMRLRPPAFHRRTILWQKHRLWLVVDEILGTGEVEAASHLHLRPDLGLTCVSEALWQLDGAGCRLWIGAFGARSLALARGQLEPRRQGWYSERFGEILPNTVLTLQLDAALPVRFGYAIFKSCPGTAGFVPAAEGCRVEVAQGGRTVSLRIDKDGAPGVTTTSD